MASAPHAAKADVAGGGVDRLRLAGRRAIAQAVAGRAQMGATLDDPSRDVGAGPAEVVAVIRSLDLGVAGRAAAGMPGDLGAGPARRVVVARPLPDVAGHVVQAVAVGREQPDGGGAAPAAGAGVAPGKIPLPEVGQKLPVRTFRLA